MYVGVWDSGRGGGEKQRGELVSKLAVSQSEGGGGGGGRGYIIVK